MKNNAWVRIFIIVSFFFLLGKHWASYKAEKDAMHFYCIGIFNNKSITKHETNCENYQELIENDKNVVIARKHLNQGIMATNTWGIELHKKKIFIGLSLHFDNIFHIFFFWSTNNASWWWWPICIFTPCFVPNFFWQTPHLLSSSINCW